jgi:UDP-galactopyranose mutase
MPADLVCFSHLRWDYVFQRPNHLMVRAARDRRVFFVEEPAICDGRAGLDVATRQGVTVVRPHVPDGLSREGRHATLGTLMDELVAREDVIAPWLWYYTPIALAWTRGLDASAVVYDCMDELSAFRGASPVLLELESELLARADVVFTGGMSLYDVKSSLHPRVHPAPSSVDRSHFLSTRADGPDPADQATIPHPRIGYYGVIDERIDVELVRAVAGARPDWRIVLVGPVAKLSPSEIPTGSNVHLLGMKPYEELPAYLRGWDVAIMPFALNAATRFISPTKTPEYLAGGKPVVSTPIRDVVEPYGRLGIVRIAETADAFVSAIELALGDRERSDLARADALLAGMSWDETWARMEGLVEDAVPAQSRPGRGARVTVDPPRVGSAGSTVSPAAVRAR